MTIANDDRLASVLRALREAPGIAAYAEIFPRLQEKHLQFLGLGALTPSLVVAELLTKAARQGPNDLATVGQIYRDRGDLPAMAAVADSATITQARMEWQRRIEQRLGDVQKFAALCDREGVRCTIDLTWAKRFNRLRDEVTGEYADDPAAQDALALRCFDEMQRALQMEKEHLQDRLRKVTEELADRRETLEDETVRRASEYAESVRKLIEGNDLIPALRKLGVVESLVSGRTVHSLRARDRRLPLPQRRNPLGKKSFHFEEIVAAAKKGLEDIKRCGLADYLPDENALAEAMHSAGFVVRHAARRVPEWGSYFAALREWLGLGESRPSKRVRRLQRLDMPNLEPKGANLPGRWTFLEAEPWQGAPYYEDLGGRPRVLAILRLAVPESDRNRPPIILKYISQTLRELLVTLPAESDDERRFRDDGLVIVLLPGEILSGRKYDQFRQQVQLEKAVRVANRIAYLDDLDLLRLLPVPADDRFRGILELVLPRFPGSLSQTYQNSDAVRSRMFFGRRDELTKLENGTTVVFSGRKMGKSSLLHRLRAQCSKETGQRAIMVGCSGIARGRSWMILREIERELEREIAGVGPWVAGPLPGSIDDSAKAMQLAKERFRSVIDNVMQQLQSQNVQRLYVLLDEADNFVRAELEETSGGKDPRAAVSWLMRDLQTTIYNGRLRFIFAGYDQIGRVFRDPGLGHSAFGNWGEQPLKLGPLDEISARDLVVKPLTALGMIVSDDLAERILDYTSGHASLIQAFCRRLAERVREIQSGWPLDDVGVEFDDIQAVADDQRGAADQNYRQLLEQTLGLNLDIARAYPLKLLFLALVSPNGLGVGRVLGSDGFTIEDALEQVESPEKPIADLTPTLVLDSLDVLVQLGLLDDVSDTKGRAFAFKARHYVNVLRTKNGFHAQLQQAVEEWGLAGRRANQVEPRYVWTLPDSELRTLRQHDQRPAIVVALHRSGRGYLAETLASPFADGTSPERLNFGESEFASRMEAHLVSPPQRPVIVTDPDELVGWETLRGWLRRAREIGLALRWIGGPSLAWQLAGDLDIALLIEGPFSLGPLTAAELEPWAARKLGGDNTSSAASVPDAERGTFLEITSGLLPVLELFREWLLRKHDHFPDPLRLAHAQEFLTDLGEHRKQAEAFAERLALGLPPEFRVSLHHLFTDTMEWGEEIARGDLAEMSPHLCGLGEDGLTRLLDAATWLGLLRSDTMPGQVFVPNRSVLGLLIRQQRFGTP